MVRPSLIALYWQALSLPGHRSAGHACHFSVAGMLSLSGRREAAVAATADEQQLSISRQFMEPRGELVQRNVDGARHVPLAPFVWPAYVNHQRAGILAAFRLRRIDLGDLPAQQAA